MLDFKSVTLIGRNRSVSVLCKTWKGTFEILESSVLFFKIPVNLKFRGNNRAKAPKGYALLTFPSLLKLKYQSSNSYLV